MVLLERTPDFLPALGPAAVALAATTSAALLVSSAPRLRTMLGRAAPRSDPVTGTCTAVDCSRSGSSSLYDCAGAAS